MVMALGARPTAESSCSDGELITRTRAGDERAYEELYRRHVKAARAAAWCLTRSSTDTDDVVGEAFTQILSVLQRGRGPEEAFRPYLLTCVRHACSARGRDGRTIVVDPAEVEAACGSTSGEEEHASWAESRLMEQAFYSLPERWQTVLWQTEVEGRRPSEVSRALGLAPGAVAALSYRARKALAEAYLEAHLSGRASHSCQSTVHQLPGAVRGTLATRDQRKVEAHLLTCESCRAAEAELRDLNRGLRSVLLLAVAGIPAAAYVATKGPSTLLRRLAAAKLLSAPAVAASVAAVVTLPLLLPSAAPAAGPGPGSARSSTTGAATADPASAARYGAPVRGVAAIEPTRLSALPSTGSLPVVVPDLGVPLSEVWAALSLFDLLNGVARPGSDAATALVGALGQVVDGVVVPALLDSIPRVPDPASQGPRPGAPASVPPVATPPIASPPLPDLPLASPAVPETGSTAASAAPIQVTVERVVAQDVSS